MYFKGRTPNHRQYKENTGNEGAKLTETYEKAALIVFPKSFSTRLICQSEGFNGSIKTLSSMVEKCKVLETRLNKKQVTLTRQE